ncbi:interleukin 17a/f1 [Genypterus blacodes]|uniref:interleukin 17a/f1 n=1 Tax=Genypterus blacodes TaxID=154954 RepID=UPI003F762523
MIFASNCCRLTAACVSLIMMMMATDAAAMPKSEYKSKSIVTPPGGGASAEWYPLQLENSTWTNSGHIPLLGNNSISPWTDHVSFDDSRYPAYLAEARCSLQGCLDSDGEEDQSLESKPIMRQVLMLRRVKPGKGLGHGAGHVGTGHHTYHFRLESRVIAVGCTCVRPSVLHQH